MTTATTTIANYIVDIRNASVEDVQRVATAIAKAGSPDFEYTVKAEDMEYTSIFAYTPDFRGFNGVSFGLVQVTGTDNDYMIERWFLNFSKHELHGGLTVAEAIKMFNL